MPTATFSLDCHADREERDLVMATWLEEHGVELVVLAGYMHLLTKPFLDRFPGAVVNVHPSLLPQFPGTHAIEDALAAGVETTGVTVHHVDEGVDTGPVIRQEAVPVEPRATLEERIHAVEHRLLPAVVAALVSTRVSTMRALHLGLGQDGRRRSSRAASPTSATSSSRRAARPLTSRSTA